MSNRTILTAMFLVVALWLHAQQAPVATGGNAAGSGGKVSYSVGQVPYLFNTGSGGKASEGVQQPYEIFTVTGIGQSNIDLNVRVFPNPTQLGVQLSCEEDVLPNVSYELYDLAGKFISADRMLQKHVSIDMALLPTGTYTLYTLVQGKTVKSFKIIKN